MTKYHAQKVKDCPSCGFTHDSKAEAARCGELHLLVRVGSLRHVDVHPVVTLGRDMKWTLDFLVHGDTSYYEDVKGVATRDFLLKLKLFCNSKNPIPLRIVEAVGDSWASHAAEDYAAVVRAKRAGAKQRRGRGR